MLTDDFGHVHQTINNSPEKSRADLILEMKLSAHPSGSNGLRIFQDYGSS
jgi:hypothetical protein